MLKLHKKNAPKKAISVVATAVLLGMLPMVGSAQIEVIENGNVGIGTTAPAHPLHVWKTPQADNIVAKFQRDGAADTWTAWANTAREWRMGLSVTGFMQLRDQTGNTVPFQIANGAPTNSLYMASNGNVGVGTATPSENLEVQNYIRSNALAGTGSRVLTANPQGRIEATNINLNGISTGTGAANQVTYWTGAQTQAGSNNLRFDGTNLRSVNDIFIDKPGASVRFGVGHGGSYTNVAIGYRALDTETGLANSVVIGNLAGRLIPNGNNNGVIAIGAGAMENANNVGGNIAIGTNAMRIGAAADNVAIGANAMASATTGTQCLAIGSSALSNMTTGTQNCGLGAYALSALTSGERNIVLGGTSGMALTTGSENVILGGLAFNAATTSIGNIGIGSQVFRYATGNYNVAIGAGMSNVKGNYNVGVGPFALAGLTTPPNGENTQAFNTGIGANAGQSISTGINNTIFGARAGWQGNGSGNLFMGYYAGAYETGSNRLLISAVENYSQAQGRERAIISGVMNETTANQVLTFNAKVGVFTQSPNARLHVLGAGSQATTNTAEFHNSTGTNNALVIRDDGNVGVGTSGPARKLHVAGEVRISDLITDAPTQIVGADVEGDLATITIGNGLSLNGNTLNTAPTSAGYFATSTTLGASTGFLQMNANSGGVTLTIDNTMIEGRMYVVRATNNGANAVTVQAGASHSILVDGSNAPQTSYIMANEEIIRLVRYGTNIILDK